jgi:4-hydroxybenzoyl-CoA thioesterase
VSTQLHAPDYEIVQRDQRLAFIARKWIRFSHCDPAKIIFYPQYFMLAHEVKEDFFREALDLPFAELIGNQGYGFPIVRLEAEFMAPSRMGERVEFEIEVAKLGRSSLGLNYSCSHQGQVRMRARTIVVCTHLALGTAHAIPDHLRSRLARFAPPSGAEA